MYTAKIKILFSVLLTFQISKADLPIGSECTLKSGLSGICQSVYNCGETYNKLKSGAIGFEQVSICNQQMRYVCCPQYEPGEMSEKKCKEYGKIVLVETNTTPSPDSNDTVINKCIRQFENNLVGADRADTDEFPHQALLGYGRLSDNDWMCGGSLVSPDFVLTAAHCLTAKHAIVKAVKLGMETRLQNDENTLIYGLKQTFIHPSFRGSSVNDIALIQLDKTVKINERIFPICLPTKQHDDYIAIGTGFGRIGSNDPQPNNLLKVELEKFETSEIEHLSVYNLKKIVDRSPLLFYGHHSLEKDTCKGDSGGPLQLDNTNQVYCTYTQIGVVSAGASMCGTPKAPSIFANVYHYLEWIEKIIWADEFF